MQNQFRFSLLGSNIELRSNSDLPYMEKVFRHLESKVSMTQETLQLNDPLKAAIISAFLLVDDLLSERAEREQEGLETKQMIEELQELLQNLE